MLKIIFSKFFKFFYALFLLPFSISVFITLVYTFRNIQYSNNNVRIFFLGCGFYLIVHLLLYKPIKIYILGHELMHAISAYLCGFKVGKIKVKDTTGQVKVNKINTFVALSPYFFPIYSIGLTILYIFLRNVIKLDIKNEIYVFLLGVTIMFHIVLTIYAVSQNQTDFNISGWLYSFILVFIVNCLVIISIFLILFPLKISGKDIFGFMHKTTLSSYGWVYSKVKFIYEYLLNRKRYV